MEKFETVVMLEESANQTEFSFKAIKNLVLLSAHPKVKDYDNMIKKTGDLLRRSGSESKADVEQAINEILDVVSNNLATEPKTAT